MKSRRIRKHLKVVIFLLVAIPIGIYLYNGAISKPSLHSQDPIAVYEKKLQVEPESVKASNDMAAAYETAGMHDKAISVYNRMLTQNPDHPDLYVNLAAIQIKRRNAASAVALGKKAIELEPGNATAHNNLAVAYYMQSDYELAIEHCDLAIKYGYNVRPELIALLKPYRE